MIKIVIVEFFSQNENQLLELFTDSKIKYIHSIVSLIFYILLVNDII